MNFAACRAKGINTPWNDVLIATIAVMNNLLVYASDKHFAAMSPVLGFSLYQPGYNGMYNPD